MNFIEYNPYPGRGCVLRTFTKLLDKDVEGINKELEDIASELGYKDINEIDVFDKYFANNNYKKIDMSIPVRDLKLEKGKYGVFCFKGDIYHMFAIIDNNVYDKNKDYLDLDVISIYQYEGK